MMHRPGMTLIETLAGLALLSALVLASSSWTVTALKSERHRTASTMWDTAAEALARRIGTDLSVLDRAVAGRAGDARSERVRADERRLTIRTRRPGLGPVEVEYAFDQRDGLVRERVLPTKAEGQTSEAETVLGHVGSWSAAVLVTDPKDATAVLTLTLTSVGGPAVERRWVFDRGRP